MPRPPFAFIPFRSILSLLSILALLSAPVVLVPPTASAQEAPNVFLCVENLSFPKEQKNPDIFTVGQCISILSVGFGILPGGLATTKNVGKFTAVNISKFVESTVSPWLVMSGIQGAIWSSIRIEVFDSACAPTFPGCNPTFKLEMFDVLVDGVFTSAGSGSAPIESATLVSKSGNTDVTFPR